MSRVESYHELICIECNEGVHSHSICWRGHSGTIPNPDFVPTPLVEITIKVDGKPVGGIQHIQAEIIDEPYETSEYCIFNFTANRAVIRRKDMDLFKGALRAGYDNEHIKKED